MIEAQTAWYLASLVLLITLIAGLLRIWHGPNPADRMLAAQLFGTTGVGILLTLGQAMQMPALNDVALVLALLATIAMVAFVKRMSPSSSQQQTSQQQNAQVNDDTPADSTDKRGKP